MPSSTRLQPWKFTLGCLLAILFTAYKAAAEEPPKAEATPAGYPSINWLFADTTEAPDPTKPNATPPSKDPVTAWQFVVKPDGSGADVELTRITATIGTTVAALLKNPPKRDRWSMHVEANGSTSKFEYESDIGLRRMTSKVIKTEDGRTVLGRDLDNKHVETDWAPGATVWPASMALWVTTLKQAQPKVGATVVDPLSGNSASLTIEATLARENIAAFSIQIMDGARIIESFTLQLRKDKDGSVHPIALITSSGQLLIESPPSALAQIQERYKGIWTSQTFLAKDGSSILDRIRPLLAVRQYQGIPLGEGLSVADFNAAYAKVKEIENSIVEENPETVLAGCRMLMSPNNCLENQRLMVLAARTGVPAAMTLCSELFDTLEAANRSIVSNELMDRADPKSLDALVLLLSKANFNARRLSHRGLALIIDKDPSLKTAIGQAAVRFLDQPGIWFQKREGDTELDDVILLFYGYPVPAASQVLLKNFPAMTISERDAVMQVSLIIRDELCLNMVRQVLADQNGNSAGLKSACRTAGEMGDLECVPRMIPLLDTNDQRVANAAFDALRKITFENLGKMSGVWVEWWDAFLEKCQDMKTVLATAENKDAPIKERLPAIRIISALRPKESLALLTHLAQAEPSPEMQIASIRGLARQCGPESIQLFINLLKNANPEVAREAHAALKYRTEMLFAGEYDAWQKWLNEVIFDGGKLEQIMKRTASAASFTLPPPRSKQAGGIASSSAGPGGINATDNAVTVIGTPAAPANDVEAQESTANVAGWATLGVVLLLGLGFAAWMYQQSRIAAAERESVKARKASMRADMSSIDAINRKLDQRNR